MSAFSVVASAPGKAVLLGEYAVLEGAPALVAAVPVRAVARVGAAPGALWALDAPELGMRGRGFAVGAAGVRWQPPLASGERVAVRVLEAVLADVVRRSGGGLPPCLLATDTRAFLSPAGPKLGFGSSAAVAAAAWAALSALGSRRAPAPGAVLEAVLGAHRRAQRGVGSGADVAAACLGGVLVFRRGGRARGALPECRHIALPGRLRIVAVFTGVAASTAALVRRVEEFARHHRGAYRRLVAGLGELAVAGCRAAEAGDVEALLAVVRAYFEAMAELGGASGADIVSAAHWQVRALVEGEGAVYKPAGAGGGDIGLAFTGDPAVARRVLAAAAAAGLWAMELVPEPRGVEVELGEGEATMPRGRSGDVRGQVVTGRVPDLVAARTGGRAGEPRDWAEEGATG